MASYPRTLRNGNTPALRAVIDGALAANNVPTASDDQMAGTGDCDHIDLVLLCAGAGGSYSARVWWWNADAELWILDTVIGTINMTTVIGTTRTPIAGGAARNCSKGIYIEVLTFAGNGVASAWLTGRTNNQ